MQIKVTHDLDKLRVSLGNMAKQVNFAAALALTKTAVDARTEILARLPSIIDRPTSYTMRSMYVRKATPKRLESEVGFKDNYQAGPEDSKHYLMALIRGGERRSKRFEGRLIMTGKLSRGEHLVPTKFADFDGFGNVSRGQIAKILSQLKTAVVQGDTSNASDSKRSKAKRATEEYFWSPGPGGKEYYKRKGRLVVRTTHLRKGVWKVRRTAWGNAIKPIFFSVSRTRYRKQFDMAGIVNRVQAQKYQTNFDAALKQALATAR